MKIKLKGCRFKQSKRRWQKRKALDITITDPRANDRGRNRAGLDYTLLSHCWSIYPRQALPCVTITEKYIYNALCGS